MNTASNRWGGSFQKLAIIDMSFIMGMLPMPPPIVPAPPCGAAAEGLGAGVAAADFSLSAGCE